MTRSINLALAVASVIALAACASPPKETVFDKSNTFAVSKDVAWERLIMFFTENNIQVRTIEKDSGVIYAEKTGFDNGYADCGTNMLAPDLSRTATFNVFVRPVGGGKTQVTVNSEYKVTRQFDGKFFVNECKSTGLLESRILTTIRTGTVN
ncbi:hypothetical protein ACRC7T_18755 [Segnochrobactraceae bacterium EtOH-i3]